MTRIASTHDRLQGRPMKAELLILCARIGYRP